MPRDFPGLSGSRIPLRGFTQLLKNLSPAERDRVASAFADAENMLDFHNRTVPQIQTRRRISGLVQIPVLVADSSVLGASVRWDRLDDPRISLYEIQVDNTNVFPNPEVFEALDTFFTLENVNTVKFVRVRGVRLDGLTGNWSDTVRIQPTITAPEASSHQFYQGFSGSDPDLTRKLRYGGPGFYPLMSKTFYVDREVGSLTAWGYISNRLKEYKASNLRPWDRVRFKVNGIARMDQYFPLWTDTFNDLENHPQLDDDGTPMSFYMKGGYTAAFGPYAVDIPTSIFGEGPNDPHLFRDEEADTPSDSFYWQFPSRVHNQMKWEQGQQDSTTDLQTDQESFFVGLPGGRKTGYLTCQDFRFNFDPTDRISGVEVHVKRRQILPPQNLIAVDDGPALPNLPLDNIVGVTNQDIAEDTAFGRHVVTDAESDRLQVSTTGGEAIGHESGDGNISASLWINTAPEDPGGSEAPSGTFRLFQIEDVGGSIDNQFEIVVVDLLGGQRFQINIRDQNGNLTRYQSLAGAAEDISVVNTWNHVVATWNGATATGRLYLNGLEVPMSLALGGTFDGWSVTDRYIDIMAGDSNASTLPGPRGQTAIWAAVLGAVDAAAITAARGNADLRENFSNYNESPFLLHYWLRLPGESDIRDFEVFLIDEDGNILTETVNQAVTTESWPVLDEYSSLDDADSLDGTALASASGIPHDNIVGIGYQVYGSPTDTWGFYNPSPLTADIVNNSNFGVAFRARNEPDSFSGTGLVDHIKMTVYRLKTGQNVKLEVEAGSHNNFYVEREVFSGIFNVLEVGPKLAPDLSDC